MKKILLALFALLPVLTAFAQTDWTTPTKSYDQYWMVGVRYGIAQFHGDVSDKSFFAKLNKESKPSFGISLGRQFTPALSFKVSYLSSNYFSKARLHWKDTINFTDLSVTGRIKEFGVYGTLNLNKLFSKNQDAGKNWFVYFSSGIGIANWNSDLKNEDNNSIIAQVKKSVNYDYTNLDTTSTSIATSSKLSIPFTFGANVQIVDGIWLSLEHSIHFVNSDRLDSYLGGYNDNYSTTTFGITANLQKLFSINFKKNKDKAPSYSTSTVTKAKPEKRSILRNTPKSKPEIQEYTGYNALLPPPQPKIDTTRKTKSGANNGKNIWVAKADSGQLQITDSGKVTNDVYSGFDPQTAADLKTGLVPTYRVQIQASKTYIQVETLIKKLDLKEKVSVELRSDGWYRYYIGQYALLPDARAKLAEMRAKGLKDAFIVSFKTNTRKVIK